MTSPSGGARAFVLTAIVGVSLAAVVAAAFVDADGSLPPAAIAAGLGAQMLVFAVGAAVAGGHVGARPSAGGLIASAVAGAFVGLPGVWLADAVTTWLPSLDPDGQAPLTDAVRAGGASAVALVVVLVGLAPVGEELLFRGVLFRAVQAARSARAAAVVSTLVFLAWHLDPVTAVGLSPLAAWIGFARWRTGSVWPGVVCHAVNNAAAVVATTAGDASGWVALGGLVVGAGCAGLLAASPRAA